MSVTERPLRCNRDFVLLLGGQAGSMVGSSMTALALVMLGYAVTGSSALAGIVSAVYGIAMAVSMLPAGAVVDRVDRKTTMVVTAAVGAVVLGSIPVAGVVASVTYPHLIVVAAIDGVLACFYNPAEMAALKSIVPPDQMGSAMAANQARGGTARLIGPPAAGALFGVGRTLPFLVDAATYAVAGGCAALVRRRLPAPPQRRQQHLLRDVGDGLAWLRRARPVRDLVVATMVSNCAFTGASTAVLLALQQAGTPSIQLGVLQAGYGVASIVGAVLAPQLLRRLRVGGVVRLALWVCAVTEFASVWHSSIGWMGACIALGCLVVPASNTAMSAYQMHVTPPALLGRSDSAASFGRIVMIPIGSAAAGILVQAGGRVTALLAFASLMVLAAALATLSSPIRQAPRTTELHGVPEFE